MNKRETRIGIETRLPHVYSIWQKFWLESKVLGFRVESLCWSLLSKVEDSSIVRGVARGKESVRDISYWLKYSSRSLFGSTSGVNVSIFYLEVRSLQCLEKDSKDL